MTTLFKNNAASTLSSGLAIGATSMNLVVGDNFPVVVAPDVVYLTIENATNFEIVKVTARALGSNAPTIVRAQEGTTERAWLTGDIVSLRWTAAAAQSGANAQDVADAALTAHEAAVDPHPQYTTAAELASAVSGQAFPSGTAMLFVQTTAPTGWTKSTTHDNKALRIVSGTAGSGGTVGFSSAFASKAVSGTIGSTATTGTVGATTLSTAQIPSHTHSYNEITFPASSGNYDSNPVSSGITPTASTTGAAGSGGSHDHSFTGSSHSHSFSGTAIDMAVQYVDAIIATKD